MLCQTEHLPQIWQKLISILACIFLTKISIIIPWKFDKSVVHTNVPIGLVVLFSNCTICCRFCSKFRHHLKVIITRIFIDKFLHMNKLLIEEREACKLNNVIYLQQFFIKLVGFVLTCSVN